MRQLSLALALLFVFATNGLAANISGEYIEARTCNVYTGPCFANAEMGLAGINRAAAEFSWPPVRREGRANSFAGGKRICVQRR